MKNIVKKIVLIIIVIACVVGDIKIFQYVEDNELVKKEGIVDRNGKVIVDYKYKYTPKGSLSLMNNEKYFEAYLTNIFGVENKRLYIDINGNEYSKDSVVALYSEGRAGVYSNSMGKYGYIDYDGKKTSKFIYDEVCDYLNGVALVVIDNKCGLIDLNGKEILQCNYDDIDLFMGHTCARDLYKVKKDKKNYLINSNEETLAQINDTDYTIEFRKINDLDFEKLPVDDVNVTQTRIIVKYNSKYGMFDDKGNKITDFKYDNIEIVRSQPDNDKEMFLISKNGKKYLIDNNANVIMDCTNINIDLYGYGLLRIYDNNNKCGVIDLNNKEILTKEYDRIMITSNYMWGMKNNKYYVFDKKGNLIFETKVYDNVLGNGEYFISQKYDKFLVVFYGGIILLIAVIGLFSLIHVFPIKKNANKKQEV